MVGITRSNVFSLFSQNLETCRSAAVGVWLHSMIVGSGKLSPSQASRALTRAANFLRGRGLHGEIQRKWDLGGVTGDQG